MRGYPQPGYPQMAMPDPAIRSAQGRGDHVGRNRVSENTLGSEIPFCLLVSVLVPCSEGLCIGNPELAAPSSKNKY